MAALFAPDGVYEGPLFESFPVGPEAVLAACTAAFADLADLPLIEIPGAPGRDERLAVILTGDGGWADIDKSIGEALAARGVADLQQYARKYIIDKPFVVGDAIAVDQFEGEVAHVGLKSTRVRSVNGEEVVFANTDLLKSRLRNLSRRQGRRYLLTLTVAPSTPAERVARVPGIVKASVAADGRAMLQRSHLIAAGLNGPEIETSIIIPGLDYVAAHDIRQAILIGILAGLEREGITLARSAHVAPA